MIFDYLNMDLVTELLTAGLIESAKYPNLLKKIGLIDELNQWKSNERLKILLIGYNGALNTGADVRVEAMVRQFYHILGKENIEIGILSLNPENSKVYFGKETELIYLDSVFFKDVLRSCSKYHMAVLSEGSCFKSKFANALTTFFVAACGVMKSQGKPVIGYGSEAGEMDFFLKKLVRHYCNETFIISRTEPSLKSVRELGLDGSEGTDTAWIFKGLSSEFADSLLKKMGWDGKKPLLGLSVINPFHWPVRPNLFKFIQMKLFKTHQEENYDKWYFFTKSEERTRLYENYLDAIANSVIHLHQTHNIFPVMIGMERLDYGACESLKQKINLDAPIISSRDFNGYEMTSVLQYLSLLITSRYHARVLSMGSGVPSIAISMDERLKNLLTETGHVNSYYLDVDESDLKDKLVSMGDKLWEKREMVRSELKAKIPDYCKRMALMGKTFYDFVSSKFDGITIKEKPESLEGYLP